MFKKAVTVLGSALLIGATAGMAAAASYPTPFTSNTAIVVGASAAPSDNIAAASIVGAGLRNMDGITGDEAADTAFVHKLDNMNPPSIKEWYRDNMEARPGEVVTNIVATPNGTDLDITWDAPADINPGSYLVYVLDITTNGEVNRDVVTTEAATIDVAAVAGGTVTVNVRVNDSPFFNTDDITVAIP